MNLSTFNLAELLTRSARTFPDRTALVCGRKRLTYAEVDAASNRVANLLVSRGVQPVDRVALTCPNTSDFSIAYYGILKCGATVVPLNVMLRAREIAYHLLDSGASVYLCWNEGDDETASEGLVAFDQVNSCRVFLGIGSGDNVEPPPGTLGAEAARHSAVFSTVPTDEDATAVILYTSGTTGRPKGAELRHRNMRDNALVGADIIGADASRPDIYLSVLPLFHSFGQTFMQNGAFAFGGTVVMLERFDVNAVFGLMRKERITLFAGVPTMFWGLIGAADAMADTGNIAAVLRVAISGGAALPVQLHRDFQDRFGLAILEGYGLSETSPCASFSVRDEPVRPGSIGRPIPGVEMKLINDDWADLPMEPGVIGEIAIKGHNVMKGYLGRPEATAEVLRDGWFRTGDLARIDDDGWYYIVDRTKDMIIRGGYNVYPREVEELLMQHPAVSLAAVIGIPHERHGEEIKAFVILRGGTSTTSQELGDWAKGQLAAYKYPRIVEIVSSLPMTATGKILKRELTGTD